jgi:hypothetical protein
MFASIPHAFKAVMSVEFSYRPAASVKTSLAFPDVPEATIGTVLFEGLPLSGNATELDSCAETAEQKRPASAVINKQRDGFLNIGYVLYSGYTTLYFLARLQARARCTQFHNGARKTLGWQQLVL